MGWQKPIALITLMSTAKLEIKRFRKPNHAAKIPETKSKTLAQKQNVKARN